jgi:glycosyltransferase involved in cell wall biosynthesis
MYANNDMPTFTHRGGSRMTRLVAFVGPIPPPVNGFSSVCAMMQERLRTRIPVELFDRAPKLHARLRGILLQFLYPAKYFGLSLRRRGVILYLALSGGRGQFIDLIYVLVGKLFRQPIFIHHHSFIYINSPSWLNRCFFALVRDATHIALSPKMGQALVRVYGLNSAAIIVLSNAAFYESDEEARAPGDDAAPLQLGFLSNISFEKGIVEFFGILERLTRAGVPYRAHVAGPLAPDARQTFNELLGAAGDVEYVGPVYGGQKDRFYRQLDVFLFPTNYANEAEPLVIYEAMRQGVHVIACDRGAIAEMLGNGAGLAVAREHMVESAVAHIVKLNDDRHALAAAKRNAMQQARRFHRAGKVALEDLLACMQGMHEPARTIP